VDEPGALRGEIMSERKPQVVVIAGPNGAGKTTAAQTLLPSTLDIQHFVNADWIARGLSGFNPEAAAIDAGRIMLARLKQLAEARATFAFETTLATRSFAPWLRELCHSDYLFALVFLWLPDADQAILRVADRVRHGGHNVPADTIRRRYEAGLRNFFDLYQPLAAGWRFYDNSKQESPRLVASGSGIMENTVNDEPLWQAIRKEYRT
jgi:predicted ABC-type ATPase